MNPTLSTKLLNIYWSNSPSTLWLPICKVGPASLDHSIDFLHRLDAFFGTECLKGTKHSTWTYLHQCFFTQDTTGWFLTNLAQVMMGQTEYHLWTHILDIRLIAIYLRGQEGMINCKLWYIIHSPVFSHIHVVLAVTCTQELQSFW